MRAAWLSRATVPLDSARRSAFRAALRIPSVAGVLRRRDARLAAFATVHVVIAFALSVLCPVLLLVLGPVLLGVAHVAADVRYLVVRRELPRVVRHAVWAGCLSLIALRVAAQSHVLPFDVDRAEWALASTWLLGSTVLGAAQGGRVARGVIATAVAVALGAVALCRPEETRLWFVQGHNVVALVLWLGFFRRRRAAVAAPMLAVAAAAGWLGSGALYQWTLETGQAEAFGLHVLDASDWFAPGLRVDHAVGVVSAFVFMQSVHYAVWLLYVPQDDQPFEATRSFRASLRELLRDFGRGWLGATALAAALVVVLGALAPVRTRHTYLSLAMFHGYLELAMLGYFLARGGSLLREAR